MYNSIFWYCWNCNFPVFAETPVVLVSNRYQNMVEVFYYERSFTMHQKDVNIYRRKAGRLDALCQGRKIESRRHSTHKKGHTAARKKRAGHKSAPVVEAPGNNPILFKEAAVLWMKARTGTCKGATVMKYDNLLRRHILPSLGGHELSEINTVLLAPSSLASATIYRRNRLRQDVQNLEVLFCLAGKRQCFHRGYASVLREKANPHKPLHAGYCK